MARAWLGSLSPAGPDARRPSCLVRDPGTIPVGLVGLIFGDYIELMLRNPLFVASTLAVFGILMWLADRLGAGRRDEYTVGWPHALRSVRRRPSRCCRALRVQA